jgi:hypothetical protein
LTVVFTNYISIVGLTKKSDLSTTVSTEKLNFCLVYMSEYISQFELDICYKPGKVYFVPDMLLYLPVLPGRYENVLYNSKLDRLFGTSSTELQYTFTVSLVAIGNDFKNNIVKSYSTDSN